jgi:hypothetical protein
LDTVAFADLASGEAARPAITGAKTWPFSSSCALRAAGVAPSKNSVQAAVIWAAAADSGPDDVDDAALPDGVALDADEVAGDAELLLVVDVDGEELLHPATRTIVTATAATTRVLPSNQTTTALPFPRRWTGHTTDYDATANPRLAGLGLRTVEIRRQV